MMKTVMYTVLLAAFALALSGIASAQPPPGPLPPGARPEALPDPESREMLEQVMVTRLSRRLELSDEQSIILMRRFSDLREKQQRLRRERLDILQELRTVLRLEEDETQLRRLMQALRDVDARIAASEHEAREALRDMDLTVWQQARLELFLSEFEGEMRRLVQHMRGDRPMQPRMGPDMERARPPREGDRPGDRPRPGRTDEDGRPRPRRPGPPRQDPDQ